MPLALKHNTTITANINMHFMRPVKNVLQI